MTRVVIWEIHMGTWAATEAKAKFSEVLDRAAEEGPQLVRRRKSEFLLMTREDWMSSRKKQRAGKHSKKPLATGSKRTMAEFFRNSPLRNVDLDRTHIDLSPRHIDL